MSARDGKRLILGRKPYRIEVRYLGGPHPYLRFGRPDRKGCDEYMGAIDGRAAIKRLRDYITKSVRVQRRRQSGSRKPA